MDVKDVEKVANEIKKYHFVFSSSLHGIIFSHSLGIPAIHIEKRFPSKKILSLKIIIQSLIFIFLI